jgi:alpha-tubulin suppressor-like RCC1 family protein
MKKYSEARKWCLKMKKLRIIDRPNIQDIFNSKESWTIDNKVIDLNTEMKAIDKKSKIYPLLKMNIRNSKRKSGCLDRNLSNKLNEYFERNIKLSFVHEKEVIIITKDDNLYKIGLNNNLSILLGLNDGSKLIESALVKQLCKKKIQFFACGTQHFIALSEDRKYIYCWGRNESGQLGNGIKDFYENEPQLNKSLSKRFINDIKCGSYHSLALTNNEVYAWGKNSSGQIGNGNNENQLEPIKVSGFKGEKIISISCGAKHSLALTENGKVFSWGLNDCGQLGIGTREDSNVPCLMVADIFIEKISCGSKHCLFLSNDNEIYAVGNNEFGQLGNNNGANQSTPIKVNCPKKFENIASHSQYDISVGKTVDNVYYVWGRCEDESIKTPTKTKFHSFNDVFLHYLKLTYEPVKENFNFDETFIDYKGYFELFENEEKLGSGSYGTVFKVREKSTKQWFSIKKIAFKSEMKNELLKQLEISHTIRELDNKYLVKYFNAWFEEEKSNKKRKILYIQMEACDTNWLKIIEELSQNSDKKIDDMIIFYVISELFFELLSGVDYLHKKNIIHRNLNPTNVLIKKGLDKNFVKISGFGLIVFHQFEDQMHDQYRWHLRYAAPELTNGGKYNYKVDIYSLGVILQELFRIDFHGY